MICMFQKSPNRISCEVEASIWRLKMCYGAIKRVDDDQIWIFSEFIRVNSMIFSNIHFRPYNESVHDKSYSVKQIIWKYSRIHMALWMKKKMFQFVYHLKYIWIEYTSYMTQAFSKLFTIFYKTQNVQDFIIFPRVGFDGLESNVSRWGKSEWCKQKSVIWDPNRLMAHPVAQKCFV